MEMISDAMVSLFKRTCKMLSGRSARPTDAIERLEEKLAALGIPRLEAAPTKPTEPGVDDE